MSWGKPTTFPRVPGSSRTNSTTPTRSIRSVCARVSWEPSSASRSRLSWTSRTCSRLISRRGTRSRLNAKRRRRTRPTFAKPGARSKARGALCSLVARWRCSRAVPSRSTTRTSTRTASAIRAPLTAAAPPADRWATASSSPATTRRSRTARQCSPACRSMPACSTQPTRPASSSARRYRVSRARRPTTSPPRPTPNCTYS